MKDKIKFVIIGSGNITGTYLTAVSKINNAEVTGILSRQANPGKFDQDISVFNSLAGIPENSFDAVIICTPNGLHHVHAVEAANMGKHVLCEKPIDIRIQAIDDMINACRQNNVKLGVSYQRRFSSDNPAVKELIDKGRFGKIFSVDLTVRNYRDDSYYNLAEYRGTYSIDGGGPFIQQASHYIDLYQWFFGRPQKLVSKLNTFVHDIEVEDHGSVICEHQNGMIGTITASTATRPGFPAKLEIYSDLGYCILINDEITEWEIDGIENPSVNNIRSKHTGSSSAIVDDTTNHELVISDFIESILTGKEPLISGESAKTATEIILDIYNNQF